jgi:hypothetical protein
VVLQDEELEPVVRVKRWRPAMGVSSEKRPGARARNRMRAARGRGKDFMEYLRSSHPDCSGRIVNGATFKTRLVLKVALRFLAVL